MSVITSQLDSHLISTLYMENQVKPSERKGIIAYVGTGWQWGDGSP